MIKGVKLTFSGNCYSDDYCIENDIEQCSLIEYMQSAPKSSEDSRRALDCLVEYQDRAAPLLIAHMNDGRFMRNNYHELAIMMDFPAFLQYGSGDPRFDNCLAISMHSNSVIFSSYKIEEYIRYFGNSISKVNLEIIELLSIENDTFDTKDITGFLHVFKYFSSLDNTIKLRLKKCLINLLKKDIRLCKHQFAKIPLEWQTELMDVYSTPRWKFIEDDKRDAGLIKYYEHHLSNVRGKESIINFMNGIRTKLYSDGPLPDISEKPQSLNVFLEAFKKSNYIYYMDDCLSIDDLLDGKNNLEYASTNHSNGDDLFMYPRRSVYSFRDGDKIYLFDKSMFVTICEKKHNFYNRKPLPEDVYTTLFGKVKSMTFFEESITFLPIDEFIEESIYGRKLNRYCSCSTYNPTNKLLKKLYLFGIEDMHLSECVIEDVEFKLAMTGYNMGKIHSSFNGTPREVFFDRILLLIKNTILESRMRVVLIISNIIKVQFVTMSNR
jgi:hypothetical protein